GWRIDPRVVHGEEGVSRDRGRGSVRARGDIRRGWGAVGMAASGLRAAPGFHVAGSCQGLERDIVSPVHGAGARPRDWSIPETRDLLLQGPGSPGPTAGCQGV